MDKLRWMVSAWLLLAAIPSCGSGTGGGAGGTGGGSGTSIPIAEFPAAFVDAICGYMARCGQMPDKATCQAAISPDLPRQVAAANAGNIKYDANAAAACVDAAKSVGCSYWDPAGRVAAQSCQQAFRPLVINGGPCFISEECISGYCKTATCSASATCCAGTCVPGVAAAGTVAIGGDCSSGCSYASMGCVDVCIDGAFCDSSMAGLPTCRPKVALGQPCVSSALAGSPCVDGATCAWNAAGDDICVKTPAEGQACVTGNYPECDSSLDYCDEVTGKCVRKIPVGGSCTGYNCVDYATCDSTGKCVALGRIGDPCSTVGCLGDLKCSAGYAGTTTCTFPSSPAICE